MTNLTGASQGAVTTLVTTGPDGAPIDEASQQSTLSNASAGECYYLVKCCYYLVLQLTNLVGGMPSSHCSIGQ